MNIKESPKYAQMCREYLNFSKTELDNIRVDIEKANFDQAHNIGHKMKGTAGAYQLTDISKTAEKLQEAADHKNTEAIQLLFDKLFNLIEATLKSL